MAPSDRPDPRGTAEDERQNSEDREDEAHALVRAAASRLYAEAPADFIATRTALVKEAKAAGAKDVAKEIGALRKPSVAAWFINQVAHAQHPVIAELADLGARLRQATSTLDAAAITSMRGDRDAVLADLVRAVHEVADDQEQSVSASVEAEVRDTGIAALADEAAEEVLRSGTMTRALAYAGFGEVDLSQSAATTSTGVVLTSIPGGRKKSDKAERAQQASDAPTAEEDTTDEVEVEEDSEAAELAEVEEDSEAAELVEDENESGDGDDHDVEDNEDDEDSEDDDDGADALAEAAAEEEHERRIAQAEQAVDSASREIGRRRAALDAARNRSDATRQRIQKLEAQLERARADDDDALDKVSQAVAAAKRAEADLKTARAALSDLSEQAEQTPQPEPTE
ncbi:hypothetical protein [Ornithinimicrobium cryptoxanthini]|uniref:Transposase n=1 Tax=Ornithinimicrobium cryptoxanthini TaxID=2934161 RepID=A0ABY4YHR4_9MICO|nr:hypothetical protein [Ornithinimicrobium cryptoxanthini]USQ76214.1 hypothetical protein NF557_16750 [Ornithinimicrobium cryptoxanthini]